jgi:hypothetical protein
MSPDGGPIPGLRGDEEHHMETMDAMKTSARQSRRPVSLNGVDTPTLFATIGAVKARDRCRQ